MMQRAFRTAVCSSLRVHASSGWINSGGSHDAWHAQVEAAAHSLPEAANGVYMIQSSEAFEALVKVNADKTVVLLAGLTWCRPCKGLTRPVEKLAKHYGDGAVFAKVLGDHSDNTKRFFKNVLEVRVLWSHWWVARGQSPAARLCTGLSRLVSGGSCARNGVQRWMHTGLQPAAIARTCAQVKATPHISIWRWGGKAYTRVGANKTKLEESVRRFFNTAYDLPDKMLYPPLVKPEPASARK